ncbi:DUF4097 family beta strand repeat-containing protein [Ornithinibacillus sp. FSL M8-0202]|uniref:DUF4097 family beta strand repeat-containing protein n=1 Tax=unclassified Ornithinibacillus TaxID=2620869 RepID=UPI0030CBEA19
MPRKKLWIIIASCLFVVGVIGSLLTYKTAGASSEDVIETEVIDNQGITTLNVKTDNARVEVLPTSEKEITVEFTSPATSKNKYKFTVEEDGDTLAVEVKEKRILQFISFDFSFQGPSLVIYLPEKQYAELKVDVINGRVNVEGLEVEHANVQTINGRIELEDLTTITTYVSSENGRVELTYVDGEITSNAVNGRTTLITNDLDRSIDLETVNGKIEIQTMQEPTNAAFEVSVVNGKVDILGDNSKNSVFGEGAHKIKLKTVNGSITVRK